MSKVILKKLLKQLKSVNNYVKNLYTGNRLKEIESTN